MSGSKLVFPGGASAGAIPIIGQQDQWAITPILRWNKDKSDLMQMVQNPRTGEQRWIRVQADQEDIFEAVPSEPPGEALSSGD